MKQGSRGIPVMAMVIACLVNASASSAQKIIFSVAMDHPENHYFEVSLSMQAPGDSIDLNMPVWTPGYYQRLDYAGQLEAFQATDAAGRHLSWQKPSPHSWRVYTPAAGPILLHYRIRAARAFVATPYLDAERGYIVPAGVFLYPSGGLHDRCEVRVKPFAGWNRVATGLDSMPGEKFTYTAPDFDRLYDCPMLIGRLEELPSFTVQGIPHYFIGYQLGAFDRAAFLSDLKKIVEAASAIIGDIPYRHYTFIAIGPGRGGIEHLNSTTISFDGSEYRSESGRIRLLSYIAHEYFHLYNVKRIRPVELGPFDYEKENRTRQLWISEGLTVYYEYLSLRRAGITTDTQLLDAFRSNIQAFEDKPGEHFQSLAQASYETWSDGPFGRTGDELNKTISYYDKGPVVGMLLDFRIRQATHDQKSLDDVMRSLYHLYYQQKKRGFTEDEFRRVCTQTAGVPLDDFFDYIYTTRDLDYKKYLGYAGLTIDLQPQAEAGGWAGFSAHWQNDSLAITSLDWKSPAWDAGLHPGNKILAIDGKKPEAKAIASVWKDKKPGDRVMLKVLRDGAVRSFGLVLGEKLTHSFRLSRLSKTNGLQDAIFNSWTGAAPATDGASTSHNFPRPG